MRLLLDTHLFIWMCNGDRRITRAINEKIERAESVYISSASVWEFAIKHAIGKIDGDLRAFLAAIEAFEFHELPISGVHARAAASLPPLHKDPFDRILIGQAISEPLRLLTSDAVLQPYSELVTLV